jgi:uncharacterized protein YoxC
MFSLVTLLTFALGILGYILSLFDKDKQPKIYRSVLAVSLIFFIVGFWVEKKVASDELKAANESKTRLESNVDSLKSDIGLLRHGQDSVVSLLQPFVELAKVSYPGTPTVTALEKLAASVPDLQKGVNQLQAKLLRLPEKTTSFVNPETKLTHSHYSFRSQAGYLRDLRIEMTFDDTLVSVLHRLGAASGSAMVMESGTRLTRNRNRKGFLFTTNELHPSNDVLIEVISMKPLRIVSESCSP